MTPYHQHMILLEVYNDNTSQLDRLIPTNSLNPTNPLCTFLSETICEFKTLEPPPLPSLFGIITQDQRWKATKYICSSIELNYNFDLLVLYFSISIFCYFLLLLHYISEGNMYFLLHYIYMITLLTSYIENSD